ncbi:hypothetical protein [Aquiflexum lacus]|uniref:hypothetical protein n=1 Tax=Aquiflexum lacus TaxID=2483805 RepID=UPI001895F0FA|nr:hypothetical protein [Aquiflexum lacus]
MKKSLVLIPIFIITLFGCSKKCFMDRASKWQTTISGADVNSQVNALTELIASVNADVDKLDDVIGKASGEAKLNLSWNLDKTTKKKKYKETVWDKDVWHSIEVAARSYCSVQREIDAGYYNTPELYTKALEQLKESRGYLELAKKKAEESITK